MRGTVQKMGRVWYAVIYDGVNATGDYRSRWVQASNRRAAEEMLMTELVKRAHRGETVVSAHSGALPTDGIAGARTGVTPR